MCDGIPVFSNNKKAFHGTGTSSHSTAADKLKIKEDHYLKSEYHFWDRKFVPDHYDETGKEILRENGVDLKIAEWVARVYIKEHFSTDEQVIKSLTKTPPAFSHIRDIKNNKRRDVYLKTLFGKTEAEYKLTTKDRDIALQALYMRIKNASAFHPQLELPKKEIGLKVDLSLGFLNLPKVGVEFKYIENRQDYANANAKWWYRIYSARAARFLFVEHLPKKFRVKTKQYKGNPFMPIFELFEMGLWPVGVVGKKFRIYIPLVNGNKPVIK